MKELSRNIKRIIKGQGLTREDLAEKLGITGTSVSRLVNGNIRLSSLEKLADALNCDVADFFRKKEEQIPVAIPQEEPQKPERSDVYGFLRIGDNIVEISCLDDLREAFLKCEINSL